MNSRTNVDYTHSYEQLLKLLEMAENYGTINKCQLVNVHKFHRDMSYAYYEEIMNNCDGWMETITKDINGHKGNPLIRRQSGLHLSITDPNEPNTPESIFGILRVHFPADMILNPERHSLYFTDFYCMRKRMPKRNEPTHYIVLMVTDKGSQTDRLWNSKLPSLDITNNMFICKHEGDHMAALTSRSLRIEVFYTEKVNIKGITCLQTKFRGKRPGSELVEGCGLCDIQEKPEVFLPRDITTTRNDMDNGLEDMEIGDMIDVDIAKAEEMVRSTSKRGSSEEASPSSSPKMRRKDR